MVNQSNVLLTICGMILKFTLTNFSRIILLRDILFKEVRDKTEELKQ